MPVSHVDLEGKELMKKSRGRRRLRVFLLLLVFLIALAGLTATYLYKSAKALYDDSVIISSQVRVIEKSIADQDVLKAKSEVLSLRVILEKTDSDLSKVSFAQWVPYVKDYYSDAKHGLKAAILATEAGEIVADSVIPFGDILGLKGVKNNQKAEKKRLKRL